MDFIEKELNQYIEAHTADENELLARINRETYREVLAPRMLSGHLQGRVLSMLSHMIKPKSILEIGTYTGYSALCMAEGLQKDGKLYTLDRNEELETRVKGYFAESEYADNIEYHIGQALDIIPALSTEFDLVFIDADKENYSNYLDMITPLMPIGGYIIADNVLWSGKVLTDDVDKSTVGIIAFNKKCHEDPRFENVLFPIRDGLMVLRKVAN